MGGMLCRKCGNGKLAKVRKRTFLQFNKFYKLPFPCEVRQPGWRIDSELLLPSVQVHCFYQAEHAKPVVKVEGRDEYCLLFHVLDAVFHHLPLRSLPAVKKVNVAVLAHRYR